MTMSCVARGAVLGGILIALVAGAPARAGAADALVAVGDELAVGKNRTGEACRIKLVDSRAEFGGLRRYSLFCDGWTQPSGEILSYGASKGYTLEKILTDSGWAKNLELRVGGCGPIEPTKLGSGASANSIALIRSIWICVALACSE